MTMDAYALYSGADRLFALRALVGLTGEGAQARTGWIHVAPEGSWEGHPDGAFTLTTAGFESCIYDAERRATPQSVDYEHASLYPTGEPTPAAGYVQKLERRADGLWALVEFTERAATMIKAGEYRFCSGVFAFERRDRQTGDVIQCMLDSIALTNRPFIDGQEPIALSQRALAERDMTPPQGARDEAEKGLAWRREHGRGGTEIGVARARDLSNGKSLSKYTIKRMLAYFSRHEVDKQGNGWSPGEDGFPSAGRIAWALWGGDAGYAWARKMARAFDADERAASVRAATVVALNGGRQHMNMIKREAMMAALDSLDGNEFAPEQLHALVEGVVALEAAKNPELAEHAVEDEGSGEEMANMSYRSKEMSLAAPAPSAPMAQAVPPMIGEPAPAIDQTAQDAAEMIMGKLTSATGMDAAAIMAALDQNLDAVLAALMGAAAPSAADTASSLSVRLLSQQLGAVKERLAGYEKAERAATERALDLEVDALVQDGKILPASREQWRTLARTAREQFRALTSTLPRVVPMGREATATATASSNATALGDSILDMTDPRVVALTAAMDRAGVQDSKIRATRIREALGKRAG
jgi:phage I-like protein